MHWHGSRIGKDLPSNFNFCLKRMAKIRSACRYYNGGKVTGITAVDFSRAMLEALPVLGWFEIGVPPVIHSCLGFSINQAFLDTPIFGYLHLWKPPYHCFFLKKRATNHWETFRCVWCASGIHSHQQRYWTWLLCMQTKGKYNYDHHRHHHHLVIIINSSSIITTLVCSLVLHFFFCMTILFFFIILHFCTWLHRWRTRNARRLRCGKLLCLPASWSSHST